LKIESLVKKKEIGKFFTQKLQKPTIEQEKIKRKIQSNCMSHSPLTKQEKLYKIITIPSVKKKLLRKI